MPPSEDRVGKLHTSGLLFPAFHPLSFPALGSGGPCHVPVPQPGSSRPESWPFQGQQRIFHSAGRGFCPRCLQMFREMPQGPADHQEWLHSIPSALPSASLPFGAIPRNPSWLAEPRQCLEVPCPTCCHPPSLPEGPQLCALRGWWDASQLPERIPGCVYELQAQVIKIFMRIFFQWRIPGRRFHPLGSSGTLCQESQASKHTCASCLLLSRLVTGCESGHGILEPSFLRSRGSPGRTLIPHCQRELCLHASLQGEMCL